MKVYIASMWPGPKDGNEYREHRCHHELKVVNRLISFYYMKVKDPFSLASLTAWRKIYHGKEIQEPKYITQHPDGCFALGRSPAEYELGLRTADSGRETVGESETVHRQKSRRTKRNRPVSEPTGDRAYFCDPETYEAQAKVGHGLRIFMATWLEEPSQGAAMTTIGKSDRLVSFYHIRNKKALLREYVNTGLVPKEKKCRSKRTKKR